MRNITENEMKIMLRLFKDVGIWYNSNNLSKEVGISPMGTLKILRNLRKENILKYREEGRRKYYYINYQNPYAMDYVNFLLKKEARDAVPRVKRWLSDLQSFEDYVEIAIVFGSVLRTDSHNDVDIVMVYKAKNNSKVLSLVKEKNMLSTKRIHPIRQTMNDLKKNIKKGDKAIMNALKFGIVGIGHQKLVEVVKDATYRQ